MIILWIIIFFLLAVIAAVRPVWAVVFTILITPLYVLRVEVIGIPSTILEASALGVILGYAVRNIRLMIRGENIIQKLWAQIRSEIPGNILVFLLIVVIGWLLATLGSIDVRASLGALKSWLIEPILFGLIVLQEFRTEQTRKVLERGLLSALIWVSFAGLVQLIAFSETVEDGRLSSVFSPVANYYAMFAAPLIVYAFGMILANRDRTYSIVACFVGLVALFLSHSYGGMLAVLAGSAFMIGKLSSPQNRWRLLFILGLLVAVYVAIQIPSRQFREKINFTTRSSSLVRTEIWRTAFKIGQQHPIFGIGPNTFELAYRDVAPTLFHPPLEWLVAKPHNLYLNLWVETGILGLIGSLGCLWLIVRRTLQAGAPGLLTAGFLVAVLVHGFVDTPLFKNDLAVIASVAIVLGLLGVARPIKKLTPTTSEGLAFLLKKN